MSILSSVQYIKGVGPKRAEKLKKLNIYTIEDLLYYFPREYEDRRHFSKINECKNNTKVNINASVYNRGHIIRSRRGKNILKVPIKDETGIGFLYFFNQDFLINTFKNGDLIKINGIVKIFNNEIQIHNCTYEKADLRYSNIGLIAPIYSLTNKLTNNEMIKLIRFVINEYEDRLEEILPENIINNEKLISLKEAIKNIHFPQNRKLFLEARKRLVLEELLILQLGLFLIKNKNKSVEGISFNKTEEIKDLVKNLPFKLTKAQNKVIEEILDDMKSHKIMNRLVQGDVGSGKTIVAICAIYNCIKNGYQSVMMAPTEILATQHFESINNLLSKHNIKCELLVGSLTKKKKNEALKRIENGEADIVIGTHALIQENVKFYNLGLSITDEQHRFGVRQRALLNNKGKNTDVIVMTATPIPRTLSLILYGDLDVSIIDELPPGRKKVKTYVVDNNMRDRVYNFVKEQVLDGRQAYIVCPLVEESEALDIKSATELYEELVESNLKELRVALLHGKMKSSQKDKIMESFKEHKLDVLISTTVIEVGVNVPNSNIMVIENSERFGLAQLHQLRGRVGRGNYQSYCVLINNSKSKTSKQRMKTMESTTDGFVISEEDLKIRGPGEVLGTRQHGLPQLKIANLFKDINLLKSSQTIAHEIICDDPLLKKKEHEKLRNKIISNFKDIFNDISFN